MKLLNEDSVDLDFSEVRSVLEEIEDDISCCEISETRSVQRNNIEAAIERIDTLIKELNALLLEVGDKS